MDYLSQLADKYKTDKGLWHHSYTPIYNDYFKPLMLERLNIMELGIGGYEFPDRGGESLKMWQEYFCNSVIHGVDIHDKSLFDDKRIKTYIGSQDNGTFLNGLVEQIGQLDIIIDDASHINALTIATFEIMWKHLKSGGIYVVEDIHTSYWKDWGYGGSSELDNYNAPTVMNYFKRLLDSINSEFVQNYDGEIKFKEQIKSIHFYKSLIFIFKV